MAVLNRQKFVEYAESHWQSVVYAKTDCQQFVQDAANYAGWTFNSSGSNDMQRNYCKSKGNTMTYNIRVGDVAFKQYKPGDEYYDLPSRYKNDADKNDYHHVAIITEIKDGKYTVCHSSGHKSNGRKDTFNTLALFAKSYPVCGTLKNTTQPKTPTSTPVVVQKPSETVPAAPTASLTVSQTEKTIWNFFTQKGLKPNAVAGIMGNLYVQSQMQPTCLTGSTLRKTYNNATYTKAVDNGTVDFVHGGGEYGLAQWGYWSRKQALLKHAKSRGTSVGNLDTQLNFMWIEMQTYKTMMAVLLQAQSVDACGRSFMLKYEKPANQTQANQLNRVKFCQQYYNKFMGLPSDVLYQVKITNSKLNYRIGPGTEYKTKGYIPIGNYSITKEQNGFGYVKEKNAWIMIDNRWMKILK